MWKGARFLLEPLAGCGSVEIHQKKEFPSFDFRSSSSHSLTASFVRKPRPSSFSQSAVYRLVHLFSLIPTSFSSLNTPSTTTTTTKKTNELDPRMRYDYFNMFSLPHPIDHDEDPKSAFRSIFLPCSFRRLERRVKEDETCFTIILARSPCMISPQKTPVHSSSLLCQSTSPVFIE